MLGINKLENISCKSFKDFSLNDDLSNVNIFLEQTEVENQLYLNGLK